MADNDNGSDLGPWNNADLTSTAKAGAGLGVDTDVPEEIRFRSNIAKLVRRRIATALAKADMALPAVFLLQPTPPDESQPHEPKRVPMLDNGRHELNGKVWFVGAGPGSGHFVRSEIEDDDSLIRFVTETLNLGDVPAIVFDPRLETPSLRHYSNGLADLNSFEEIFICGTEVTLESVSTSIEGAYRHKMITSDAQPKAGKLWKNPHKWWPHRDAEDRVQMYLEVALCAAFPTCTIRREQDMPEGRLDIEIIESDPIDRSKITQHGILELKILRSFSETGSKKSDAFTNSWIKSGVEQAAAYRDSKSAKWGALLCFDMRCENVGDINCFRHVKGLAKALDVHLRRWFMYATSKQRRSALAAAKA